MAKYSHCGAVSAFILASWPAFAQTASIDGRQDIPIRTWQAPAYWDASTVHKEENRSGTEATTQNPAAVSGSPVTGAIAFVAIVPCRLVDTRGLTGETGPFGPPILAANETRTIPVLSNTRCNIPASAKAYSLNFTVVPTASLGWLSAWPTGNPPSPMVSILNSLTGAVVANAAVVAGGTNGSIDVLAPDQTQVIIDINGYYAPQISLAAGSAAAPSLTFAGDANTGLFSSGAGTVNIATGGVNRLTVRSDGDVDLAGSIRKNGLLFLHNFGAGNTGVGLGALVKNTIGTSNTATGSDALVNNTIGDANTAVGASALRDNANGRENTALGNEALRINTGGSGNTAIGTRASYGTTGGNNVAVGSWTLYYGGTGSSNTAVGANALVSPAGNNNTAIGANVLASITSNNLNNNVAIGVDAGLGLQSGSNNIYIANNAFINGSSISESGVTRIGTIGTQTSTFIAGIRGVTTGKGDAVPVVVDSNGQLGTVSSSIRFKEDVHTMADSSSGLMRLRPVTFRYSKPYADGSRPLDYGLIAEEVADVYPDLVVKGADGQIETIQYQKLTPMLLNELQKEHRQIQEANEQIRLLESRMAILEAAQKQGNTRERPVSDNSDLNNKPPTQ